MTLDEVFGQIKDGDKLVVTQTNKVWLCPVISVEKSPEREGRWLVSMGRESEKIVQILMDQNTLLGLFMKQEPTEIKLLTADAPIS